jgi:hypothetical protein
MIRVALLFATTGAAAYALASWICGLLTDAGIAAAVAATLLLVAEGISYCERRRDERSRRTREEVWERRDAQYPRVMTFGPMDMSAAMHVIDTRQGIWRSEDEHGAVWPHEVGGFE